MITLTQMEYVLAVDKHRHFREAAEACHVSQPTLSMQLHKLEEELGVVLFDRTKKPVLPTPEGVAIIEQMKIVMHEHSKLSHISKNRSEQPEGDYRLGVIPSVAPYLLPHFVGDYLTKYPLVRLHIQEMRTEDIERALVEDRIDGGILATPLQNKNLIECKLYYEPFALFAHKGHELLKTKKINPTNIKNKDIWLLTEGHCFKNQVLDVCNLSGKEGTFKNLKFEAGSLESIIRMIRNGTGYTLLPILALDSLHKEEMANVRPFNDPQPSREISLVIQRSHFKLLILDSLLNHIREHLPAGVFETKAKNLEVIGIH
jgi:LysR family transcriptional regulator, hydrogen peroxide-inducible genes activator